MNYTDRTNCFLLSLHSYTRSLAVCFEDQCYANLLRRKPASHLNINYYVNLIMWLKTSTVDNNNTLIIRLSGNGLCRRII